MKSLEALEEEIIGCRRCPRLVEYRELVARKKRRQYAEEKYWGRPVPGFGDKKARLLIVGLAPGAHGSNRTGRMFTGDKSGEMLYEVLFSLGFCNQKEALHGGDGLQLKDSFITAAVRCVPPQNKPSQDELKNCFPYLQAELRRLPHVQVIVALGAIAFQATLKLLREEAILFPSPQRRFAHGAKLAFSKYTLFASYHPSQQNTQTGRLTRPMFYSLFKRAALALR